MRSNLSVAACARRAVQRRRDCCVCCETGLPKGGEEGLLRGRVRADARAAFFAFLTRRRARPVPRHSNLCPAQSNLKSCRDRPDHRGGNFASIVVVLTRRLLFRSERSFYRMAPRSEPLGSRPAPWLKTSHWHQIAFQAARTRAVIISGIGADSGSKGCLRRRSGKGQRESGSKRAALNTI